MDYCDVYHLFGFSFLRVFSEEETNLSKYLMALFYIFSIFGGTVSLSLL